MKLLRNTMVAAMAGAFALPACANDDLSVLKAELKRLSERIESLERQNREMEKSLDSQRVSESEPELVTRLKAVEFQTLSMQKQARQIEALEGITVGASLTGLVQKVGARGTASGLAETRANYRGDISVTLPGGEMGNTEGKIFGHFRFGQGNGIGLRPTYTSSANTTAFEVGSTPADDSFGILAQAWYQLTIPLMDDGLKANAREHLHLTAGKIDPFVFFDQNVAADDESARFMNNTFVHNPLLDSGGDIGADAYGFAPGAIVQYVNQREKGSEWGLSLGVFGSGPGANFTGSLSGPLVIAQAETAARFNYLPGNYRVYLWRNGRGAGYDGVEQKHAGIGVSVDQKVSDELTLFGRHGRQTQGKVRFDRALTLGAELAGSPWARAADSIGLALGALRTSGDFRNDAPTVDADGDGTPDFGYPAGGTEKQMEIYYRYRLNSHVELTPDFQWIRRAGGDGNAPTVKVFGLRARVGF
ncbi:carbohydrate porin [Denitratisoma oestradiolicum]|uniref:Porin n=1 Tax=Denitratisoma oestradiolicum TaxID=311182 RepID=A0A6S6XZM6_9PROT|nr:carbohydrate porin [Denitratisoma oestradiolicum]TWO79889.1 transporter [Denitratisoma oestradiolicum]CAB1369641.1 Porin [Denitratisoma oestradiolicum]